MAFSFKNLFGSISAPKAESVIGIDIGASAIKAVQLRKKGGRAVLETYGELALGPYADTEVGRATNLPVEKIKEALTDLFREANVTSRDGAIAIPLSSSLVSLVEMPDLGERRMAEMVPIEARRYIPVPISEVSLDWWIIPKENRVFKSPESAGFSSGSASGANNDTAVKKTDVLLVAILNDAISRAQSVVKEVELQNVFFEIEVFSTSRSVLDQGIEPVLIFDMGAGTTKLYLVEHGIIKDSHIINRGSQDITLSLSKALDISVDKAEEMKRAVGLSTDPSSKAISETISLSLDFLFSEANQVLLSFERKYNRPVSKVVLSGGGASMKGFTEAAKVHFQSEVELADPFSKVVTPAFLQNVLQEVGPEFAVAMGLALRKINS